MLKKNIGLVLGSPLVAFLLVLLSGCPEPEPGTEQTIMLPGNVPLEMVWIRAGTFMMGRNPDEQDSDSSEDPRHQVQVKQGFWLGKYPVTQAQWQAVMGSNPSHFTGGLQMPVESVSWDDIRGSNGFLENLNVVTEMSFRLPSEAEWEYACRAGTTTRFHWGDDPGYTLIDDYAWYNDNSGGTTHVVGQKLPNAWGLYDMGGNVWEWCEDDWHDTYTGAPSEGSAWLDSPRYTGRIIRGGSCNYANRRCRSAYRDYEYPDQGGGGNGFRLAR